MSEHSAFESYTKSENEFFFDGIIDLNRIRKTDFNLRKDENFEQSLLDKIKRQVSRKNIIKFGIMVGELPIPIEQTTGDLILPIINKEQIKERLRNCSSKDREQIAYIHCSTIQIILKSTFKEGLDTPIILQIRDDRLKNYDESVIAEGHGNLTSGKLKFNINIQLGLSLKDKDLDNSIIIHYELQRSNFMKKGNSPFSITYQINYALTNSHHSLNFQNKDTIEIDDLFRPILHLNSPIIKPRLSMKLLKPENRLKIERAIPIHEIAEDQENDYSRLRQTIFQMKNLTE